MKSNLKQLKDAMLLDMGLKGMVTHMNKHAKKVVGAMALTVAMSFAAPASAGDINRGGVAGAGIGYVAGNVLGSALGVNDVVTGLAGAAIAGMAGNSAYDKHLLEEQHKADIAALTPFSPDVKKIVDEMVELANTALANTQKAVVIADGNEMSVALLPDSSKMADKYVDSVRGERAQWNAYVDSRNKFSDVLTTAEKHGFNVEEYKVIHLKMLDSEKETIASIHARTQSTYFQHNRGSAPR